MTVTITGVVIAYAWVAMLSAYAVAHFEPKDQHFGVVERGAVLVAALLWPIWFAYMAGQKVKSKTSTE